MTGDKRVDRGLRDLPDFALRVMGFRGTRDLVDTSSSSISNSRSTSSSSSINSDSSLSNSINSSGRTGALSAVGLIHRRSVTRGRDGASYVESRDIFGQHAPEQSCWYDRSLRPRHCPFRK